MDPEMEKMLSEIDEIHRQIRYDQEDLEFRRTVVPFVVVAWSIISLARLAKRYKMSSPARRTAPALACLPHLALLAGFIETTGAFKALEDNFGGLVFVLCTILPARSIW